MDKGYRSWRATLYLSGSWDYAAHDDIALQSHSNKLTYCYGGELDEIILGERAKEE